MNKEELLKKLKEKKVEFISEIEYNDKKYVKTIKVNKKNIMYVYYEINFDELKEVENQETLEYFKMMYEIQPNNIIY